MVDFKALLNRPPMSATAKEAFWDRVDQAQPVNDLKRVSQLLDQVHADKLKAAKALAQEPEGSHFSASQHKTAQMCIRKWYLEKVAKVRDKTPKHYFATGKATHGVAERYHLKQAMTWDGLFPPGWDTGLDDKNRSFIRYAATQAVERGVWQATPDVQIEAPACALIGKDFRDARGMPLLAEPVITLDGKGERIQGRPTRLIDGRPLPTGWDRLPRFVAFIDVKKPDLGIIEDHKSAKSRRYTLTPDKLKRDVQLLSYAAMLFAERPALDVITLKHNVMLKDTEAPDRVYATTTTVTPDWVAAHWNDVIATVETVRDLRIRVPVLADGSPGGGSALNRADRWLEVPGACDEGEARKKESCDAYGGCPYQDICFLRASAAQVTKRLDATGGPPAPALSPVPRPPSLLDRMTMSTPTSAPVAAPRPTLLDRMAAPLPAPPTPVQTISRLLGTDFIPSLTTDTPMPFPPKHVITAGTDCYIIDPEDPAVQYRVRVIDPKVMDPNGAETALVGLFPHEDVVPDFTRLPDLYRVPVPLTSLLMVPSLTATITGYHAGLIRLNYPREQSSWYTADGRLVADPAHAIPSPANPVPANMLPGETIAQVNSPTYSDPIPPQPAYVPGSSIPQVAHAPPAPTVREIAPGVIQTTTQGPTASDKNTALLQQHQRALEAAKEVLPPPTFAPVRGMLVQVAETTHKFWAKMVGQVGTIKDISQGDGQSVLTVDIDDQDFDAVVGRFVPYVDPNQQVIAPTGMPLHPATATTTPGTGSIPVASTRERTAPMFPPLATASGQVLALAAMPPTPLQFGDPGHVTKGPPIGSFSGDRLSPIIQGPPTQPATAPGAELSNTAGTMTPELLKHFTGMVGKTVRVKPHKGGQFSGVLEAADATGVTMMSGQVKLAWVDILEVIQWDGVIPGAKPIKLTADEKKAAKEARALEDEQAAREQEAKDRAANLPQALGQALAIVKTTLESGKVSKKVLEGLLPLLEQATEYDQYLQRIRDEADSLGADVHPRSLTEGDMDLGKGLMVIKMGAGPASQLEVTRTLMEKYLKNAQDLVKSGLDWVNSALQTVEQIK